MKRPFFSVLTYVGALLFLAGCAGQDLKIERIATSADPTEQINRLESEINAARREGANVLSPSWFAKSETSLKTAARMRNQGEALGEILQAVAEGRAQLKKANEVVRLSKMTLPDALQARNDARTVGATRYTKDYDRQEQEFLKLTKAIENNNLRWAKNNEDQTVAGYRELELRAIKDHAVGDVRELIFQAESEGAKKIAPQTLGTVVKKLGEVEAFISEHRYEKEEILEKAEEARFHAHRLLQVTRESKKLQAMDPEQITLWVEGMVSEIGSKLSVPDMRDQGLATQVTNIHGTIEGLIKAQELMEEKAEQERSELQMREKEIASLEGRARTIQEAKARLEAERRFNQLYEEVRGHFGPDEAEVYKQGDELLIRLKGVQFPVGQHVITSNNFFLLSKVQQAIRAFGVPVITVEGHTDSTGSEETNNRLSQLRAESVQDYLVANGTVPRDNVQSVGYGSRRPLASNENPEGRALNRRIDIIIKPQASVTN